MKILQVYNLHRHGGGADQMAESTVSLLQQHGHAVSAFVKDSRELEGHTFGKMDAFLSGLYAHRAVKAFRGLIEEHPPDLIHAHEVYPMISPWIFPVAARAGIPTVLTCHDFRLTCPVATHLKHGEVCSRCMLERSYPCVTGNCRGNILESLAYAARHAVGRWGGLFEQPVSKILTPSRFCKEWLVQAGVAEAKIHVVPNFIDTDYFRATPASEEAGDYIAFAGRNAAEKGLLLLLEAAKKTGLPLRIACDHRKGLEAYSKGANITFLPWQDQDGLRDLFRGARFVVVPSLFFESFGLVVAEALAAGSPVLATRHGALKEALIEGEEGRTFKQGDVEDLARHMQALWSDPDGCRAMGGKGRARVLNDFSPARYVERLEQVYQAVVSKGVARP